MIEASWILEKGNDATKKYKDDALLVEDLKIHQRGQNAINTKINTRLYNFDALPQNLRIMIAALNALPLYSRAVLQQAQLAI